MKNVFVSLLLVGSSLVLALLAAEGLLHAFPTLVPIEVRAVNNDRGVAHPVLGHVMRPGSSSVITTRDFAQPHNIDAHGFRNEHEWPESADVVAIGDSLVFGYGADVEQAWPQRLARATGQSVINLGLIGASPQQYQRIWETYGRELHPKTVLVALYPGNDFWDADQFEKWLASGTDINYLEWRDYGRPSVEELDGMRGPLRIWLRKNVHLYSLLRLARNGIVARMDAELPVIVNLPDGGPMRLDPAYVTEKALRATPDDPVFGIVLDSLLEIERSAAAIDARLIVLIQPTKEAVYARHAGVPVFRPAAALVRALREHQVEVVDLYDAFAAEAEAGARLFWATDGHPNADGYRLIAEKAAEALAHRQIVAAESADVE